MKKSRYLALTLSLVSLFALTTSAGALVVTDLDTGLTMPNLAWNIVNDASVVTFGANNDNYDIKVGINNWGANEWDRQAQVWHAGGTTLPGNINGYKADFTYDLNTWDSYNPYSAPQKGYWDNFGVELDNTSLLWNRIPAVTDPMAAGGNHWIQGGTAWGDGICEIYSGNSSVTLGGAGAGNTTYLSVYLSTDVNPERDNLYPSWGEFNRQTSSGDPGDGCALSFWMNSKLQAPHFSVDNGALGLPVPPNPAPNDVWTFGPGDNQGEIFQSPGNNTNFRFARGVDMGLIPDQDVPTTDTAEDNIDAISYANDYFYIGEIDEYEPIVTIGAAEVAFSVNPLTLGVAGTAVNVEALKGVLPNPPGEAHGDIFHGIKWAGPPGCGSGGNALLWDDNTNLGLDAPDKPDDVDALENTIQQEFETVGYIPGVLFSVDRLAIGAPGTAVTTQAAFNEAAADVFYTDLSGWNWLFIDEAGLGLFADGSGLQDELDALMFYVSPEYDNILHGRIYEVDDVEVPIITASMAQENYDHFLATGQLLFGFLFSVENGSTGLANTAVNWEATTDSSEQADVFFSFGHGMNYLFAEESDLGLLICDELNALDNNAQIPEPGTIALIGCGLVAMAGVVRKKLKV